ncbi:NADP-dependent fatty aldehyde dehydrogenase [Serratia quinivorans]|jgi:NADP-dependent aldehyde dehydrogenase|uniref:aldehyde dehydrogenase (NADP(+)) n=1 Tax=Serratia quinivorans TaxID=137545 RepID=UPI002178597E|nr:aldehyde dehydrogenase (NADP(+)) [Serratia quinivorans]CAI0830085.1 NADP-dependent fatty aldehyde dehydrogenase [Serratia quinivorans]CAI0907227.1 NADP-dependent fatty aldehyde dehydrogenase [Serratia quinivorans]CAI1696969.1 NADP-dependent fatty aldehyde dehydrogenase [Serratia quinivorans]CAI2084925.1 NADP-dependent fatty aldehyde dehydrogenase [Serratia quinivorans]CAI2434231.1 NADP-dependent fatty aldehyde dehydrogenase [Serratia quinivorans]
MPNAYTIRGQQFIGGQRRASGEAELVSLRADNGQPTGHRFFSASLAETAAAADAAAQAFTAYSQLSAERRADFLEAIAEQLDALDEEFFNFAMQETALPLARLSGERARTSGQMRLFANLLRRGDVHGVRIDCALPQRTPLPRPDLRQYRTALGPVAVFGASNFPLAFSTAGGDTAAALAAGCPVVFKAHSGHMITAELTAQAIERARDQQRIPAGVFNMIYGERVGAELVQHPAIQAVGFTGSLRGGRTLFNLAMRRPQPIPVFAEMSSINPLVIMPRALARRGQQIARDLLASFTLGCGQFCTKPGLIIGIRGEAFSQFTRELSATLNAAAPQAMLNAGTLAHYRRGLAALEQQMGIRYLAGSREEQPHLAAPQLYQADICLLLSGNPLLQEEVFGPVAILIAVENHQQLTAALESLQGQLTATLLTDPEDLDDAAPLAQLLTRKAGRVLFNGYPTGVEVCDAMVHGGPYPATSDARGSSVGTLAIERFLRPVCLQNYPAALLPPALQDGNPLGLLRLVNGIYTRDPLPSPANN